MSDGTKYKPSTFQAHRCEGCPFKGKVIGSRGPIDSPFVIVGESPGVNELREGVPFVGPSGTVLSAALEQHTDICEPYITNAFKCFPSNQKTAENLHIPTQACHNQLMAELGLYPRKVILALGNPAIWSVTGDYNLRITKARGKLYPSSLAEKGIIAAVHPAFLLRGGGNFRQFKADTDYAMRLLKGGVPKGVPDTTYSLIETEDDLAGFIWAHLTAPTPHIAADYETTGFSYYHDRLICAGYTINGRHSYIVPILDNPKTVYFLKVIHALTTAIFIWHNGKFDIKFAHMVEALEARVDEDTMLLSYAHDETRGIHDLETVGSDWLGSPNWKNELKRYLPKKGTYADAPRPVLYNYLAKDLYNTRAAHDIFQDILLSDRVSTRLYRRTLIPASAFLADVEKNGLLVDKTRVDNNAKVLEIQKDYHEQRFNELVVKAGHPPVNLNRPIQLCEALFDVFKIPSKVRATNEDILRELPPHPAVIALRRYRKVQKGLSTYVTPIYENMEADGKGHSAFLIHGQDTGRLSSRSPNVQNNPRAPIIRGQFIAGPGRILIEPDLNQAELRSLACMSGDKELIRIYTTSGLSLHEEVRREIYGDPKDWSAKDIRDNLNKFFMREEDRYNESR